MRFKRVEAVLSSLRPLRCRSTRARRRHTCGQGRLILAEARKAIGGDDKLAAIKTLEIKGTSRRGATDVNLEGDMTISVERPGKYLRKESIILGNAGIEIVEGLNGSDAWTEQKFSGGMSFDDGGGGDRGGGFRGAGAATPTTPAAAAAANDPAAKEAALAARQSEVARVILATLLTTDLPVKWTGTAVTPQATAEVLEIATPDGNPIQLLIDSKG